MAEKKVNGGRQTSQQEESKRQFFDLLQQGTNALQRGQIGTAVELLEHAQQFDQDHPDLTLNLAGAYILSKKFKKAVNLLEPLSEREPHNPMVWTNLGAAYLGNPVLAGDADQHRAIAAFKKALEINPVTPNVAYNIGLIYIDRQEKDKALHWFRRAVQADPNDRDAQYYIKKLTVDSDKGEDGSA